MTTIAVQRLDHAKDLPLPTYETEGAAGMDLRAAIDDAVSLAPLQRLTAPTGIRMALPEGFEAQIRPRSGLALRHGVTVLNTPGTIDSDYRGEILVLLINLSDQAYTLRRGDRIAQMVVAPVTQAQWREAVCLDDTARGAGGYGSTGLGS